MKIAGDAVPKRCQCDERNRNKNSLKRKQEREREKNNNEKKKEDRNGKTWRDFLFVLSSWRIFHENIINEMFWQL